MANTSADFSRLVREYLRTTVGGNVPCTVRTLDHDRMNDQLATFKVGNRKGINMKIRFECTRCSREWSSAYGNTQWYYKLDVRRGQRGGISSCTLSFKVHTYY